MPKISHSWVGMMTLRPFLIIFSCGLLNLAGCDQLGIETPEKINQRQEAEGKAVGAACRHAGRAIEDCYTLNPNANKAAAFEGWKEMNDYMRENKIEVVTPTIPVGGGSKKSSKEASPAEKPQSDGPGPKPPEQFDYVPPKVKKH